MGKKIKTVVVVGPTASGKTALAAHLAEKFGGEVVSADSMQIYKGMDIGTAKPTEEEMRGIPHHLIGFAEPTHSFSAAEYKKLADECIADIHSRGKLPIVAGGTGLYIDCLIDNITFIEAKTDFELRSRLLDKAKAQGGEALLSELREFDPITAERLHPSDITRIVRAIEVYRLTGIPQSRQNELSKCSESPYEPVFIGLDAYDRAFLYERINCRVDLMLEAGLAEEVKEYYSSSHGGTSVQAIGYKELYNYITGEKTLEECAENLKRATRRYAKRQLTWFRRNSRINWLYIDRVTPQELRNAAESIVLRSLKDAEG